MWTVHITLQASNHIRLSPVHLPNFSLLSIYPIFYLFKLFKHIFLSPLFVWTVHIFLRVTLQASNHIGLSPVYLPNFSLLSIYPIFYLFKLFKHIFLSPLFVWTIHIFLRVTLQALNHIRLSHVHLPNFLFI